jgi:hypothetical protein
MDDFLANNKALILKTLVWVLTTAFNWINVKYKLGIDPVGLAVSTGALIMGIAVHAGMKDSGATAAAINAAAPAAPQVKS